MLARSSMIFQAVRFEIEEGLGGMVCEFCPVIGQNSVRQNRKSKPGCLPTSTPLVYGVP